MNDIPGRLIKIRELLHCPRCLCVYAAGNDYSPCAYCGSAIQGGPEIKKIENNCPLCGSDNLGTVMKLDMAHCADCDTTTIDWLRSQLTAANAEIAKLKIEASNAAQKTWALFDENARLKTRIQELMK